MRTKKPKNPQHEDPVTTNDSHDDNKTNEEDEEEEHNGNINAAEEKGLAKKKRLRKRKRKLASEQDDDENEDSEKPSESKTSTATKEISGDSEKKTSKTNNEDNNNNNEGDEAKSAQLDRTVYLEGIPFTATPEQVREFFQTHAATGTGDTKPDDTPHANADDEDDGGALVVELRLPVWQDSGRLRGYGHLVFATVAQQQHALTLSGRYLQNRYLTIQPAHAPKQQQHMQSSSLSSSDAAASTPSATIAIHNLSYAATEADIEAALQQLRSSLSSSFQCRVAPGGVRVVRHSGTSQSKGFAYVTFETVQDAVAVVSNNDNTSNATGSPLCILGRPCRIDYDHGRVRGSFRTADRKLWNKEYGNNK